MQIQNLNIASLGRVTHIFEVNQDFLEHEKAFENLKKEFFRDEYSDEPEGSNDLGQEPDDDEDEEEEREEQLDIQYET